MQAPILWAPNLWDSSSIKNAKCMYLKFLQLKVLDSFMNALTCKKLILIDFKFYDFSNATQRIIFKGLQRVKEFS